MAANRFVCRRCERSRKESYMKNTGWPLYFPMSICSATASCRKIAKDNRKNQEHNYAGSRSNSTS